jgi:hypothetical protein
MRTEVVATPRLTLVVKVESPNKSQLPAEISGELCNF